MLTNGLNFGSKYLLFFLVIVSSSNACLRMMPTTPGIPALSCRTCSSNAITITLMDPNSQPMEDTIIRTGRCLMRTFTCRGRMAKITTMTKDQLMQSVGGTADQVTYPLTCNADGTGWVNNDGETITVVECTITPTTTTPQCQSCNTTLPMSSNASPGLAEFSVTTDDTSGCSVKTFICKGPNAVITPSTANGMLMSVGDSGTGTATYPVNCNQEGTGWVSNNGEAIASVVCAAAPTCKKCAVNLITVTPDGPGATSILDSDITGVCAAQIFTCTGAVNPTIEVNGGAMKVADAADGATDGSAKLIATCNAAGTAWELNGVAVTQVECTIPCKTCAANIIAVGSGGIGRMGMVVSTPADIVRTGTCATWTLKCTGAMFPNWDINLGLGSWSDAEDGVPDNIVMFPMTCNEFGTRWSASMMDITSMVCDASGVAPG